MDFQNWIFIVVPVFIVLAILIIILQFTLARVTRRYTYKGHQIVAFKGFINAHLYVNGKMVDTIRCWGNGEMGTSNLVLQHKQDGLDIFVRVTSGLIRPTITMKINNELVRHD